MTELEELKTELETLEAQQEKEKEIREVKKKIWEHKHKKDFTIKVYNMVVTGGISVLKSFWEWCDRFTDPPHKKRR